MQEFDESKYSIPTMKVTPYNTQFLEHKRCFEICARDMTKNQLDEKEELCAKNCLSKHFQAQVFLSQKMYTEFVKQLQMSPEYQRAFAKSGDGPSFNVKTK
ncbi:hypothetical protein ABPG74_018511 [Tetrahymena malaccensis]